MAPRAWSAARRLEFVEFRLYWHGRINRRDLREMFGISVPQAANDLRSYLEAAPGNAVYDRRRKAYIASASFRPVFFEPDAGEYFEHLQRTQDAGGRLGQPWATAGIPFAESPIVKRRMDPQVVRAVIAAIREKRALRIVYQSMTSARPRPRTMSPHAVASDGFRWHARGYLHEKKNYRDFVLARILEVDSADVRYEGGGEDAAWREMVSVVLASNPDLKPAQRRAYEFDLGMTGGRLEVPVRRALLHYFLTEMRLDFDDTANKPARVTPIVVVNHDEIKKYLAAG